MKRAAQLAVLLLLVSPSVFAACASSFSTYTYCRSVTVDNTKVGAADVTGRPVLVCFNASTGKGNACSTAADLKTAANGGTIQHVVNCCAATASVPADLVFSSANDGSALLQWDCFRYVATTGELWCYVDAGTLSHTVDTVFYMFYDGATTTYQSTYTSTYAAAYKAVYHMPDGTTLDKHDSTTNANTGSGTASAAAGELDGGSSYNGSSDTITVTDASSLRPTTLSLSVWLKKSSGSTYAVSKLESGGNCSSYAMQPQGANIRFYVGDSGCGISASPGGGNIWDDAWHLAVGTWDGTNVCLSIDGASLSCNSNARTIEFQALNLFIGSFDGAESGLYYGGSMDEVQIQSGVVTNSSITTQYNNESNEGAFITLGSATTSSGGGTVRTPLRSLLGVGI